MGAAMAGHLLDAGRSLAVYDPSRDAMEPLVARGAADCASPAEVAAQSDLLLAVVVDDEQVRQSFADARMQPGSVFAICASVRPDTCRALHADGVHVIDAAMVRGERGAEAGELVLFCGGDPEVV